MHTMSFSLTKVDSCCGVHSIWDVWAVCEKKYSSTGVDLNDLHSYMYLPPLPPAPYDETVLVYNHECLMDSTTNRDQAIGAGGQLRLSLPMPSLGGIKFLDPYDTSPNNNKPASG